MKKAGILSLLLLLCTMGISQLHYNKVFFKKQAKFNAGCFMPFTSYSFNPYTRPLPPIKYELPKGAIFCRMEDALHEHFNIWIKFRMGNDDRYSN